MFRRLFQTVALLLLLTSPAHAETINLLLTANINEPTVGPREKLFVYSFFQSPVNGWTDSFPPPSVANGNATLLPGVTQFSVSFDAPSVDNIYFTAYGFYWSGPGLSVQSIFAAEPPAGPVPDVLVFEYGPPWIPLANLGGGLSGGFRYIYGFSNGPIGTWAVTPVPEPASLFLFTSGLAAIAAKRYGRRRL